MEDSETIQVEGKRPGRGGGFASTHHHPGPPATLWLREGAERMHPGRLGLETLSHYRSRVAFSTQASQ